MCYLIINYDFQTLMNAWRALTHVKKMQLVITPLVGTTALVILVMTATETIALVGFSKNISKSTKTSEHTLCIVERIQLALFMEYNKWNFFRLGWMYAWNWQMRSECQLYKYEWILQLYMQWWVLRNRIQLFRY